MSKLRLSLAFALILGLSAAALRAEPEPPPEQPAADVDLDILLGAIRSNRKAVVAVNLGLTQEEAASFWPVYERYQQEANALGDRLVALIQDYAKSFRDLSNEEAMQIVQEYLDIEGDRVAVRRNYVEEFAKSVPGRKLARFYQIENKMDALVRYELAASIPVVEEEGAAPAR
jgi:hypothetical protein